MRVEELHALREGARSRRRHQRHRGQPQPHRMSGCRAQVKQTNLTQLCAAEGMDSTGFDCPQKNLNLLPDDPASPLNPQAHPTCRRGDSTHTHTHTMATPQERALFRAILEQARAGNVSMQNTVGEAYLKGGTEAFGVDRDMTKALGWLKRAAKRGYESKARP